MDSTSIKVPDEYLHGTDTGTWKYESDQVFQGPLGPGRIILYHHLRDLRSPIGRQRDNEKLILLHPLHLYVLLFPHPTFHIPHRTSHIAHRLPPSLALFKPALGWIMTAMLLLLVPAVEIGPQHDTTQSLFQQDGSPRPLDLHAAAKARSASACLFHLA